MDIVEIREDVIEENGINRFSNSLVSLDVDMMKRKMRTAFASIRKIPQSSLRNSSCASSVVSLASKGILILAPGIRLSEFISRPLAGLSYRVYRIDIV